MIDKNELRKQFQRKTEALSEAYILHANADICKRVLEFLPYKNALSLFVYLSAPKEPQTDRIIEDALYSGKTVCVPKCLTEHQMSAVIIDSKSVYTMNRFSIREPLQCNKTLAPRDIGCILIPCITSDLQGDRLGHGAGYYDRFLIRTNATKVCLCYDALLCDTIPKDQHDIRMDYLITESKTVRCR